MKKIILLIVSLLIILIIVFVSSLLLKREPINNGAQPPPRQTTPPTTKQGSLSVTSVEPTQNINAERFPVQQVKISFNQTINPDGIFYSISPAQEIEIRQGNSENEIIISPSSAWEEGITTIILLAGSSSTTGEYLNRDFEYSLRVKFPNTLPPDFTE
ncbi:MAG: hypothetical protein COU27_01640 [Candidatus Levybacteria bacterium CG10_big_fil_rev_8_21_14_0_10_36_7]|nr:MAG: hypothetical protein COU27_01640 [Candidatus Levybacteria bacterium CG10_big_fil_rev_8_21_14_0_10_36_7]